jgi:hypothetical protein
VLLAFFLLQELAASLDQTVRNKWQMSIVMDKKPNSSKTLSETFWVG